MKKICHVIIIFIFGIANLPLFAGNVRQLGWDDLIPKRFLDNDPLAGLSQDLQSKIFYALNILENLPERKPATEELYKKIDKLIPAFKKGGIDINRIMAFRKEGMTSMVDNLNGARVRIPGYLLSLETSGSRVTQGLLVPYVGACIHAPPPPPNQILLVTVADKKGYETKSLFDAVWVTGVISVKSTSKNLYLVDGSSAIDIGYALQAEQIEPYKD
jgi:hypothetical protein